jgi:hypothetical protein
MSPLRGLPYSYSYGYNHLNPSGLKKKGNFIQEQILAIQNLKLKHNRLNTSPKG